MDKSTDSSLKFLKKKMSLTQYGGNWPGECFPPKQRVAASFQLEDILKTYNFRTGAVDAMARRGRAPRTRISTPGNEQRSEMNSARVSN